MSDSVQLPLHLAMPEYATWSQLYERPNAMVVAQLRQFVAGETEPFIFLQGAVGSGKTVLLQTVCQEAQRIHRDAVYLSLAQVESFEAEWLGDLQQHDMVCIDAIESVAGKASWEEALFHLFNRMRDQNKQLLLASEQPVEACGWQLSDLRSRLQWGLSLQLKPLSEQDIMCALQQQAQQVGLVLSEEVAEFMLRRLPRNMASMSAAFQRLNHASLSAQRKLTVPFVKQVMGV